MIGKIDQHSQLVGVLLRVDLHGNCFCKLVGHFGGWYVRGEWVFFALGGNYLDWSQWLLARDV